MVVLRFLLLALVLLAPPLLSAWLAGLPLAHYLALPPQLSLAGKPGFAPGVFVALAVLILATLAPFLLRLRLGARMQQRPARMPWWGWASLAVLVASWVLAWTRFEWMQPLQEYTFSPLWLSYIVLVNALCQRRCGRCLLTSQPRLFLLLFPASALFWWFFEFLNRFVQNWAYSGVVISDPAFYLAAATVPFSTVLPAVLSTRDWLATYPALHAGLARAWRPPRPPARPTAGVSLLLAVLGLAALPLFPDQLFPLVWVLPLLCVVGLETLLGAQTPLAPLAEGDWRPLWLTALAALVCGALWELWNWHSLARWHYALPYVDRFEIFEMPLLGYAGYLPFGLECLAAASLFFGARRELIYGPCLSRSAAGSA